MSFEQFIALVWFAVSTSGTPGPNNMMLMASGVNYGFRRSIPHMLGISLGHLFMMVMVGLGLFQLFETVPYLEQAMKIAAVIYLLYLAWKIANSAAPEGSEATGKPFTFLQAAAFQWVNPKAWFMAVGAITVYAPGTEFGLILLTAAIFSATNFPSVSVWTLAGTQLRRWLTSPARLRAFNWTMAGLLVASLALIL